MMASKAKLYHDLAIQEYAESFIEAGYEVIFPDYSRKEYVPDLILIKNQQKTYVEFKSSVNSLNSGFFQFKENKLKEEPNSEFLMIILNESYKPKLNVQLPKINKVLTSVFNIKIQQMLKTDTNYTGKYNIISTSIEELILGAESIVRGSGIINYSIKFKEGLQKVAGYSEVNFKYQLKVKGIELLEDRVNEVISSKIEIDKVR